MVLSLLCLAEHSLPFLCGRLVVGLRLGLQPLHEPLGVGFFPLGHIRLDLCPLQCGHRCGWLCLRLAHLPQDSEGGGGCLRLRLLAFGWLGYVLAHRGRRTLSRSSRTCHNQGHDFAARFLEAVQLQPSELRKKTKAWRCVLAFTLGAMRSYRLNLGNGGPPLALSDCLANAIRCRAPRLALQEEAGTRLAAGSHLHEHSTLACTGLNGSCRQKAGNKRPYGLSS
mmetsp:Transcript_119693/g.284347  ORF Transcript_119693/g.284347 Transcript_119693/m.284347 type:complete len:225 (+) Transcript_119693:79-753(+)